MHKPRTLLGERLDDIVREVWSDVDVIGFCVPADEKIGPGDRRIAAELTEQSKGKPVIGIVTKTDRVKQAQVVEQLLALQKVREFAEIIPVSAQEQLPGRHADRPDDRPAAAEPAALPGRARSPTSRWRPGSPRSSGRPPWTAPARSCRTRWRRWSTRSCPGRAGTTCSTSSSRSTSSGIRRKPSWWEPGGAKIAAVGRKARLQIEALLGQRVYLDLHVTVAKEWQRDAKQLRKLGFDG